MTGPPGFVSWPSLEGTQTSPVFVTGGRGVTGARHPPKCGLSPPQGLGERAGVTPGMLAFQRDRSQVLEETVSGGRLPDQRAEKGLRMARFLE